MAKNDALYTTNYKNEYRIFIVVNLKIKINLIIY